MKSATHDRLALVSQWSTSGLTQQQFCRRHGMSFPVFQYWLRKAREAPESPKGFVQLMPVGEPQSPAAAELHFSGGRRLVFYSLPDAGWIKTLVEP